MNDWIGGRPVGNWDSPTFNIFIADYVDLDEDQFIKTVIKLNYPKAVKGEMVVKDDDPMEVTDLE